MQPEDCLCEEFEDLPTASEWFERYCPSDNQLYLPLLKSFEYFPIIDFESILKKMKAKWDHPKFEKAVALCRYRIFEENKISKYCYGKYTGFSMFVENMFSSLSRKMKLPEMEFFHNLGDWPLEFDKEDPAPVVSWCGSDKSLDIILPTYEMTDSVSFVIIALT